MIKCPICENYVKGSDIKNSYISKFNNKKYTLYYCLKCSLEFWYPLKILPEFYECEALDMYKSVHLGRTFLAIHHKPFFKYFSLKKGVLLDVGCGNGIFLYEAKKAGFDVYGIDFDRKSIEIAKKKFGLKNVYNMSLKEFVQFAKKQNIVFDIITFFEVLEHQDNPKDFLQDVKQILKVGGYIAGSVPNKERLFADIERETTHVDYPPHHFLYFSRKSLKYLFQSEGFDKIEFYPTKRSVFRLSGALGEMFLSNLTKKISNSKIFFGLNKIKVNKESVRESSINSIKKSLKKKMNGRIINVLRMTRNITFLPFALLVYPIYNLIGYQIYFQAKLKNKEK